MAYKGTDYYLLDELLTEEQRLIRDTVRDFVDREVIPIIGEYYMKGEFPKHLVPMMAELGLLAPWLPPEYGGSGIDSIAYGLINMELERGDSAMRSFVSVTSGLVAYPIYTFGSEEQRKKYLPKLTSGELIGCYGLTEPDAGSDPGSMRTYAKKDGNEWVLNGAKMWITNANIADFAVVYARDIDSGKILGFIVERDMKGVSFPEITGKLSLRASATGEIVLDDVRVPESNRLPGVDSLRHPLMCLTQARYGIAWGAVGAAMACYEEALQYAKERIQFGKPIARYQLIQMYLVEMLNEITKAQLLVYRLAQLKDSGKMRYPQVSLAKMNNVRMALDICRRARSVLGANGISIEFNCMRHAANLEAVYTYEGTHEMQTLIVGRDITGIEAFRCD